MQATATQEFVSWRTSWTSLLGGGRERAHFPSAESRVSIMGKDDARIAAAGSGGGGIQKRLPARAHRGFRVV